MRQGSEAQFQQQIEQLARGYGYRVYHAPDNRPGGKSKRVQRVTPGFPDLVAVRPGVLLFAELKTQTGRIRPEQAEWLQLLGTVEGVHTFLWRPSDFDDINATLARLAGRRVGERPLYRDKAA